MDLAGDEKRIRALFCELSLEDESVTPRFEELWRHAERTTPDSARSLRTSFILLVATVALIAVGSFALWSRSRSTPPAQVVVAMANPSNPSNPSTSTTVQDQDKVTQTKPPPQHRKKLARQKKIQPAVQELAILSNWQSPTISFLQSPVTPAFTSLPQLNQSARELESFLPNNDVKEFKQ